MPSKKEKIVVTAALPYANGSIHIGHLLEYIQADIFARFLKLQGQEAIYVCASDMHGTPIEVNAAKAGISPEKFAEGFWKEHQEDFASFLIKFDTYYHTNSPENKLLAEYFYAQLKKKDLIYRKNIKTIYCASCKRYLPDRFVKGTCLHCHAEEQYGDICERCSTALKGIDLLNPYCTICKHAPVHQESEHYFFQLSAFAGQLAKWFYSTQAQLQLEVRHWLEGWLKQGLEDWCISRDAPYFGFEIPDSRKETGEVKYFYVWMDAPIGYISSTKHYCVKHKQKWEDYWKKGKVQHFIGKDIVYFHFLFWPAMLLAMGIPLPRLTIHGFITVNGQKMSKTRGTFLTAKEFLQRYTAESMRFFYASHLDRSVVDVDINFAGLVALNNTVLMGNLGNFCYRVLTFAEKHYGSVKEVKEEKMLSKEVLQLVEEVEQHYTAQDFKLAVKAILKIADIGNAYFQKLEPWKDPETARAGVGWCVNLARILAIVASPILPQFSGKIAGAFGEKNWQWKQLDFSWKGKLHLVEMLVQKIELREQKPFPLRMRVGAIEEVQNHPNADSLYLFQVNFGDCRKQVVAGLKKYFAPEELRGKKAVFCVNLKPAKLRGQLSEAMALVADDGKKVALLEVQGEVGQEVRFWELVNSSKEITFEQLKAIPMTVQGRKVVYEGKVLHAGKEDVMVKDMEGARIK